MTSLDSDSKEMTGNKGSKMSEPITSKPIGYWGHLIRTHSIILLAC